MDERMANYTVCHHLWLADEGVSIQANSPLYPKRCAHDSVELRRFRTAKWRWPRRPRLRSKADSTFRWLLRLRRPSFADRRFPNPTTMTATMSPTPANALIATWDARPRFHFVALLQWPAVKRLPIRIVYCGLTRCRAPTYLMEESEKAQTWWWVGRRGRGRRKKIEMILCTWKSWRSVQVSKVAKLLSTQDEI